MIRPPVVAGSFYPLNKEMLLKQIEKCFSHPLGPQKIEEDPNIVAAVAPHAGYIYSGPVAAWTYSKIKKANYIILGPNHTGLGPVFAVYPKGKWATPLGKVEVDEEFAKMLVDANPLLEFDVVAHDHEHSIEVQLPFLQYRFGNDFKFVPIAVLNYAPTQDFLKKCESVATTIASMVKESSKWIVIASSDFTHYEPYDYAMMADNYYIKAIEALDATEFFARLEEKNASVCGFGPIAIAMIVAKKLGASKGVLLKYATSGDITGDTSNVVGYASIIFK